MTIALLFALFSGGYAFGVVRYWRDWMVVLRHVNFGAAALIGALMLLVNSPLLDFRKISTASQFGRANVGEAAWADFDFGYVRDHLARPGHTAMQALHEASKDQDPALTARLSDLLSCGATTAHFCERQDPLADVILRPEPFPVPDDLRKALGERDRLNREWRTRMLVRIDLTRDGEPGYAALLMAAERGVAQWQLLGEGRRWLGFLAIDATQQQRDQCLGVGGRSTSPPRSRRCLGRTCASVQPYLVSAEHRV